jgi:hypothetical protein
MSDIISTPIPPKPRGSVGFTTSPLGSAITFAIGGGVWVSGAHRTAINTAITFTASTTVPDVIRYEWDLGDGTTGFGQQIVHTYRIPNPHLRAVLRVTDASGVVYSTSHQIYLEDSGGPTLARF